LSGNRRKKESLFGILNINHPAVFVMLRLILNQHFDVREPGAQAESHARVFLRDGAQACHGTHLSLRSNSVLPDGIRGVI